MTTCKICRSLFPIAAITWLLVMASCSSRYQMAKSYKFESGTHQLIYLNHIALRIILYPNDTEGQAFHVICTFQDVEKNKHLKLSGLAISFVDAKTGDTALVSKLVEFNSRPFKEAKGYTELISENELLHVKVYELHENMRYSFSYLFSAHKLNQPVTKIQLRIQATLDEDGKVETIDKTYPFEKKSYLNISGN